MPYIRKTVDVYVIQQDYGYGHGWEDVTSADTRADARQALRDYRVNMPEYPARCVTRRERITGGDQ